MASGLNLCCQSISIQWHQHNNSDKAMTALLVVNVAGKVAGAKWEGSKTVFDDTAVGSAHSNTDGDGLAGDRQSSAAAGPAMLLPDIKWKKLAVAELMKVCTALCCTP